MTTPRNRSRVSLAAALGLAVALGACASAPPLSADLAPSPAAGSQVAVRFDNGARDYVHVYLIGQKREWLLGRVEPGARASLHIPDEAMAEDAGSLRLAVLTGGRVTQRAASDPRAAITLAQPATELLSLRWTFSQGLAAGQLTSLRLAGARRWVAAE